ncbi:Mediator of RNA polymerase II transcription subunit 28 [Eumeta japonica]|uniref:Mediator of RNA polymerase II transcription subunit 28 n=1 Tax=Eumeta variegata TaxID=151549 RepID=A0A4C1V385_EUMVA|nr:Mediator of RNA polymerase II transcription subunit 28 [Eumeta japonica]
MHRINQCQQLNDQSDGVQACLNVLTKQEASPCVEKEEVKVEVERFIDLARQMEAFFLQKRISGYLEHSLEGADEQSHATPIKAKAWRCILFLLSAMKPELLVKEDNNELKCELQRKDELLRRHYDKIGQWQNLLADLQVNYLVLIGELAFHVTHPSAQGHTMYAKCQQPSQPAPQAASPMPQPTCSMQQAVQVHPQLL